MTRSDDEQPVRYLSFQHVQAAAAPPTGAASPLTLTLTLT